VGVAVGVAVWVGVGVGEGVAVVVGVGVPVGVSVEVEVGTCEGMGEDGGTIVAFVRAQAPSVLPRRHIKTIRGKAFIRRGVAVEMVDMI
jgi:hypothetical protein